MPRNILYILVLCLSAPTMFSQGLLSNNGPIQGILKSTDKRYFSAEAGAGVTAMNNQDLNLWLRSNYNKTLNPNGQNLYFSFNYYYYSDYFWGFSFGGNILDELRYIQFSALMGYSFFHADRFNSGCYLKLSYSEISFYDPAITPPGYTCEDNDYLHYVVPDISVHLRTAYSFWKKSDVTQNAGIDIGIGFLPSGTWTYGRFNGIGLFNQNQEPRFADIPTLNNVCITATVYYQIRCRAQ